MIVAYACGLYVLCVGILERNYFYRGGGENVKPEKNRNFLKKKGPNSKLPLQYRLKTYKFFRSLMEKRTSLLDSSHEI